MTTQQLFILSQKRDGLSWDQLIALEEELTRRYYELQLQGVLNKIDVTKIDTSAFE